MTETNDQGRPVVYLDQGPLSELAKAYGNGSLPRIGTLLLEGRSRILISGFHILESGKSEFLGMKGIIEFVKLCDIVWSRYPFDIYHQEAVAAASRYLGEGRVSVTPYYSTFESAFPAPAPIVPPDFHPFEASVRISAMSAVQRKLFSDFQSIAEEQDRVGTDADVLRDPNKVIRWRLSDAFLNYRRHLTRGELDRVIEQNGGPESFPALWTHCRLVSRRIELSKVRPQKNHLIDEFHASYAPYVDAIVLDHGMHQRLLETKLPWSIKACRSLDEAEWRLLAAGQ